MPSLCITIPILYLVYTIKVMKVRSRYNDIVKDKRHQRRKHNCNNIARLSAQIKHLIECEYCKDKSVYIKRVRTLCQSKKEFNATYNLLFGELDKIDFVSFLDMKNESPVLNLQHPIKYVIRIRYYCSCYLFVLMGCTLLRVLISFFISSEKENGVIVTALTS